MRGRKPDALAVRRGTSTADIEPADQTVAEIVGEGANKPVDIASNPYTSDMWDTCVGSGAAFEQADVPFISQFVTDMVMVEECRRHMFDAAGNPQPMVTEDNGDGTVTVTANPYAKVMRDTMAEALKLADQLGLTRFARARLGLTQAMGKAAQLSIAEQIDRALVGRK